MDNLIDIFSGNYGLEREAASELIRRMERMSFRKGEIVVNCGAFDDSLYILESGIWSGAKSASFGDAVVWFAFGGEAVVDIFCYNTQRPSKITIMAETDCIAWRISKMRVDKLCDTSLGIANAIRKVFETNACHFEDEVIWMADKESAGKRYSALINDHPELILNVPLKKIASYLWMTPQSLSRIRAAMNKG
ncbi:MAG TPA: cAMP-binding protein [Rikenellaceae bacterium]|nr:cAMP-binding protein [Rikenellaceae bacterium]